MTDIPASLARLIRQGITSIEELRRELEAGELVTQASLDQRRERETSQVPPMQEVEGWADRSDHVYVRPMFSLLIPHKAENCSPRPLDAASTWFPPCFDTPYKAWGLGAQWDNRWIAWDPDIIL